ncbi:MULTISPECIES: flavodoxin family protein [Clostridium]|uniref:FMN reductase n=1 Tax=Clostridium diolis TaxID=223919 RepID=A0AAV3W914_9CLOT|nr:MULTISPECIES: flavodoxin family protein [Clostridium]ALB46576.1 flavodoxin family protein [Clostridium beijerinckii NRRL B-598]QES73359.1 flavodoxin family protein [Clostridium diolis]GEA33742.1 FMN reductase [Clostridium diolis]
MKVVAFNGSPNKNGNTYHALKLIAEELEKQDIEVEIIHIGSQAIRGCMSCWGCYKNQNEKCVLKGDSVNEWIEKMKKADGIILGSPVHYSGISGAMKSFLDRAFVVNENNGSILRHKVGAAVVAVRRSGGTAALDQLNKYINYSEMLMPSSRYWNVIHGTTPGEVIQDEEGVQIMKTLAKNMAWLLKLVEYGKDTIEAPEKEDKILTNFIRQ